MFQPLLQPARYKGAHGGRGSGKSHFFADNMVEEHLCIPGHRSVCIREVQRTLRDSSKRVIEDKIKAFGLSNDFRILEDRIVTPSEGVIIFQGMQDHNSETIKSLEGFNRGWVEEAQTLSERSLTLLRPTIRAPASEMWFSWNPRRKADAVDKFLRRAPPDGAIVVQANWRDNPWFPAELEADRQYDLNHKPEEYEHIWEGDYAKVTSGAYYALPLLKAKQEGRIGPVVPDPLMTIRAIWDIGGTGAKADACSIWICQFIGKQVIVLDYYEAVSQPLATHVAWLRKHGYEDALCILPHDGAQGDKVYAVSYESALKAAGFKVKVVPNQGVGAAGLRIEAARRIFPRIWFNEATTEAGREALGYYHEKRDEKREIGLGPEHDWASHGADAFGLMCVVYEEPKRKVEDEPERRIWTTQGEEQGMGWLGN